MSAFFKVGMRLLIAGADRALYRAQKEMVYMEIYSILY
jgi:hypothetical protein